jgi:predicted RNA binding protein YcfA (HicA-like mRNA interferase family)
LFLRVKLRFWSGDVGTCDVSDSCKKVLWGFIPHNPQSIREAYSKTKCLERLVFESERSCSGSHVVTWKHTSGGQTITVLSHTSDLAQGAKLAKTLPRPLPSSDKIVGTLSSCFLLPGISLTRPDSCSSCPTNQSGTRVLAPTARARGAGKKTF